MGLARLYCWSYDAIPMVPIRAAQCLCGHLHWRNQLVKVTSIRRRSCAAGLASARRDASGLNVLLITLDTTRADRLGAYGFQSTSTANFDRLAREGVLFEQTATVAPLTLPAHASLFTGRFPFAHGVRDNAGFVLDPREVTLAEILKRRGYQTGAFVGSYVLASGRGLNQGFDTYRDDFNAPQRARHAWGTSTSRK